MRISDWSSDVCSSDLGPKMGATTVVIPQIARPTFALSFGKTEISNVAESGISGPPAKPCRIRKATSSPRLCDSPHRTEHATKPMRTEEHTSELQSLMRISYAVFCLTKKHTAT